LRWARHLVAGCRQLTGWPCKYVAHIPAWLRPSLFAKESLTRCLPLASTLHSRTTSPDKKMLIRSYYLSPSSTTKMVADKNELHNIVLPPQNNARPSASPLTSHPVKALPQSNARPSASPLTSHPVKAFIGKFPSWETLMLADLRLASTNTSTTTLRHSSPQSQLVGESTIHMPISASGIVAIVILPGC
jgi:hypothetical protein